MLKCIKLVACGTLKDANELAFKEQQNGYITTIELYIDEDEFNDEDFEYIVKLFIKID